MFVFVGIMGNTIIIIFFLFRYQYSCFYELDSLAVVNVRDLGGIKHTFKLLVTPDSRLFQCSTGEAKQVTKIYLYENITRLHDIFFADLDGFI